MESLVNKVAESGIITLNLELFIPEPPMVFDLKDFLFMGLILKEKDFRAALLSHNWEQYRDKSVAIICSADAIIPVWAYMLIASNLEPFARKIALASPEIAQKQWMMDTINTMDTSAYTDQRVVIKGCGEIPIPDEAYALITWKLKPVVKSLMYGEPCSTVPVYKRKNQTL